MDEKKAELRDVLKKSLSETSEMVGQIGDNLMGCANLLRVEQTEKLFNDLAEGVDNLSKLMDFIKELKKGLVELGMPLEPLAVWDRSLGVFQDMVSAFEKKDWIILSDLMQRELHPLLQEGRKSLSDLQEKL